jgi:3-deoxy-D-manno-octulosonic-acid transferase
MGKSGEMLYHLWYILGYLVHILLVVSQPLIHLFAPHWDIEQRLGRYQPLHRKGPVIWIHAASVGEVQAAGILIDILQHKLSGYHYFLTTMTRSGREVALSRLSPSIHCALAPLDTAPAVTQALQTIQPALYICLETELWPTMLRTSKEAAIPLFLLNGRLSERSFRRYQGLGAFMSKVLNNFTALGVIRTEDALRFRQLGATEVQVCGNLKYDLKANEALALREKYGTLLQPQGKKIFLCGSTRSGEEELLVPVYQRLRHESGEQVLWLLAPRHLQRVNEVERLLQRAGLGTQLLSRCTAEGRTAEVLLVDSLGELADLYAVADLSFCGGSLVNKGGHNIMEPIRWHKPVCFGPFMADFADAVEMVLAAGAGFQVDHAEALADCLVRLLKDPQHYQQTCRAAEGLARSQQGAAQRQANLVLEHGGLVSGIQP